jgi:hypothetical protein
MATLTFVQAISKVFGRKPGQTLESFARELAALSPEDRIDLAVLAGIELDTGIVLPDLAPKISDDMATLAHEEAM